MGAHDVFRYAAGLEITVVSELPEHAVRLMDTLGVTVHVMTVVVDETVRCVIGECGWTWTGPRKRHDYEIELHRKAEHPWVTPGRLSVRVSRDQARDANRDALAALDAAIPQREVAQVTHMVDASLERDEQPEAELVAVEAALDTADCQAPGCPREAEPGEALCRPCAAKEKAETPLDVLAKKRAGSLQAAPAPPAATGRRGGMGRKPQYTRESVIELVQAHVRANGGRVPTFTEFFKAKELPSESVLRRLGWKFADVVEAAGYQRPVPHVNRTSGRDAEFPRAKILELLRVDALGRGRPPTSLEWRDGAEGRPTEGYVRKLFGSWNAAIAEAGLEPRDTGVTLRAEAPARQQVPAVWKIKVPGTGLKYRTVAEAVEAADRIEEDGERVARGARADGNDARADEAHDQALALANKIREAAGVTIQQNDSEDVVVASGRVDEAVASSAPDGLAARSDEATADADMHGEHEPEAAVEAGEPEAADADMHIEHERDEVAAVPDEATLGTFEEADGRGVGEGVVRDSVLIDRPLEEVEADDPDAKLVGALVRAVSDHSLALLEDDADGWVERLQAERDRLLAEADRMTRRAGGFQTIVDGLEVLRETAA